MSRLYVTMPGYLHACRETSCRFLPILYDSPILHRGKLSTKWEAPLSFVPLLHHCCLIYIYFFSCFFYVFFFTSIHMHTRICAEIDISPQRDMCFSFCMSCSRIQELSVKYVLYDFENLRGQALLGRTVIRYIIAETEYVTTWEEELMIRNTTHVENRI